MICVKCRENKSEEDFGSEITRRRIGRRCKACQCTYNKVWAEKHKEENKARRKAYNQRNKERCVAKAVEWIKNNRERYRRNAYSARLKREYGITTGQYNEMLEEQEGKCAICYRTRKLVVDHCHKTRKVRSLVCRPCNLGLGAFEDNNELLLQATEYLGYWRARFDEEYATL